MGSTADSVAEQLGRLCTTVEDQLADALRALRDADLGLADAVVRRDADVNVLRYRIEDQITAELAQGGLETDRLRLLIGTLSVINDLERIGDHCEGIAKVALMLGAPQPVAVPAGIERLGEMVQSMLTRGGAAFVHGEDDTARALCAEDDAVDELYDTLYGEILTAMRVEPDSVVPRTYTLWAVHNLERIADRVTNICERTVYLVTGRVEELNVSNY